MALSDVIERLAEVNEEQLLETQNVKIEIESLSDRFASFIRIAEGEKLDKLEERREERKKSRGMGFAGRAKESAQQGRRVGLTLIDLLVKGAGLAVAAGVIIPLLMQNEDVKEALDNIGVAVGTTIGETVKNILGDYINSLLRPSLPEGDVSPETEEKILSEIAGPAGDPLEDRGIGSGLLQFNQQTVDIAEAASADGRTITDEEIRDTGVVVRKVQEAAASGQASEMDVQRAEAFLLRTLSAQRLQEEGGIGTFFAPETRQLREAQAREEREAQEQENIRNLMNRFNPGSYERMMAAEEEKLNRDAIRENARAASGSAPLDTSLQSMATLAAESSMGMGEFNLFKGLIDLFNKEEEVESTGAPAASTFIRVLTPEERISLSSMGASATTNAAEIKGASSAAGVGSTPAPGILPVPIPTPSAGAGGGGGPVPGKHGVSYMSGESRFTPFFRMSAISGSLDLLGLF